MGWCAVSAPSVGSWRPRLLEERRNERGEEEGSKRDGEEGIGIEENADNEKRIKRGCAKAA